MKKVQLLLLLIILGIIFAGCGAYDVTVFNNSSQKITYSINLGKSASTNTIESGKEQIHSIGNQHSHSISSFTSAPLRESTYCDVLDNEYIFKDIAPIPANIFNTLSKEVLLYSGGAINPNPFRLPANQERTDINVLSKNPSLSARTTDSYNVQVDVNFNGNKFFIILR